MYVYSLGRRAFLIHVERENSRMPYTLCWQLMSSTTHGGWRRIDSPGAAPQTYVMCEKCLQCAS